MEPTVTMVGKPPEMTADKAPEAGSPLEIDPRVSEAARYLANFDKEGPQPDGLLDVITAAHVADAMRDIKRAARYEDGTYQTDSDHSFRLGVMALQVATSQRPDLDAPRTFMLAVTHDLPEVYSGDTPINDKKLAETKDERESAGLAILIVKDLAASPFMADLLSEYKDMKTPEAKFVYAMDKFETVSFALRTGAITQREAGDNFPDLAREQLSNTVVDPTVFHLTVRGFRDLGRRWEEWGCKPFEGNADDVVDAVVAEIVQNQKSLRENPLIIPEDLPADQYRTH